MVRSAATSSSIDSFDELKNPTLARVVKDTSLPEFAEGTHYRVVCIECGSERRDLPVFTSLPGAIALPPFVGGQSAARHEADGVPGGFVISGVLSRHECDQIVKLSETMGKLRVDRRHSVV
eukprot:TRINITY_DN18003_c0_g1_i1.p1 TRINITY_DN18003_c0_g1~~TRINITY_DN18003_c0_g1_i1.p1  ORF type:complete len:133 (-),score=15.35 TRINITY_DN18003_c0_g1_i1:617-979(-)